MPRRIIKILTAVCFLSSLVFFGQGAYIHAKAKLAQLLLIRAWHKTCQGEQQVRPWSWADTYPVARLLAPQFNIDQIVLAGCSGRTMAFGPGHVDGTALPGAQGNCAVTAHRDTHFAFLQHLKRGDSILLKLASGDICEYKVRNVDIVHYQEPTVLADCDESRLTLITCYPFQAIIPGGPLRYVVSATKIS
ncbi:class GN sortase [candidate division CSSED10-310 bacterium]|uniref:Class GN sortase n=1 Tax=candidate division CSSED10-310 bacterium TaxID=2855610 RepID=A0ABV6YVA4_UNCC1